MKSTDPITGEELAQLRALHGRLPHLAKIPFERVLRTNHLITPLRRTLDAQKKAAAQFRLTAPKGAHDDGEDRAFLRPVR